MDNSQGNNKALHIFIGIAVIVAIGVGGYLWWDYLQVQKINETVINIDDAKALAAKVLQN